MDLNSLKSYFEKSSLGHANLNLDALFQAFSKDSDSLEIHTFIAHLYEQDFIDSKILSDLLSMSKIEVTDYAHLQKRTEKLESAHQDDAENVLNYEILGKVGEGGMGEILLAKDNDLLRTVAYKKLHQKFALKNAVLEQFLNEVQITSQLEHPNVIPIYNLEVNTDGSFAYSMKLVQGKTLKELIQESKDSYTDPSQEFHSLSVLLEHFLKVCDAMAYAHNKGVLHRDLKPANIMIGACNEVYVMDWGIACLMSDLPDSNQAVGTPRYMSPEQAGGLNHKLDARSDLFTLGQILFEVLTLKQAMPQTQDFMEMLRNIIKGKRLPIEHAIEGEKIPSELKAIIEKATQRKRLDRYQSVKELSDELRRFTRGDAVLVRPDNGIQKVQRWITKNKEKSLTLMMLFVLLFFSLIGLSIYQNHLDQLAAQKHEVQIQKAVSEVSKKAQHLNEHFIYLQGLLEGVGESSLQLLNYGQPLQDKYYLSQEFSDASRAPQGLTYSDAYQKTISALWPGNVILYWSTLEKLKPTLQRLSPLRHQMRKAIIKSLKNKGKGLSPAEIDQLIVKGTPSVRFVYFAFEEGLYIEYPGYKRDMSMVKDLNMRERPWYKRAKAKGQIHWGEPYVSILGIHYLPCLMPLYDKNKRFIGVGALEMTMDYVESQFIQLNHPGVEETSIINHQGEVLASSLTTAHLKKSKSHTSKRQFPKLKNDIVLKALASKSSGYHIQEDTLYIYKYIPSQDWMYLVKTQEKEFLSFISSH